MNALIFLPQTAPEEYADRLTLWNAAESAEVRKNSRVAREVILALPHELSESQRLSLSRDMALFLVEKYGVAVDLAVHAPLEDHGDDPRNHHAHLLFTTREITAEGMGAKTRILDDKEQGPVQIELIRQVWETLANDALQQAGLEGLRVDRRTLDDQGIDRIPQEHVGKAGTHADDEDEPRKKQDDEDEDGDTEQGKAGSGDSKAPTSDQKASSKGSAKKEKPQTRANINEEIKRLNAQRAAFSSIPLKAQIKELDRLMDRLDGRVQRLKTLSEKTSLPERITKAITSLYTRAKEFFAVRTKDKVARTFTATEREAKAERQKARYGRTYRASLQERMNEMRENIQILETKQKQHRKYEAFVSLIERRVESEVPTIKKSALTPHIEWRWINSIEVVHKKIAIEAIQTRKHIPLEYRPTFKQESLSQVFKAAIRFIAIPVTSGPECVLSKMSSQSMPPSTDFNKIEKSGVPPKEIKKEGLQERKSVFVGIAQLKDNTGRKVWHKEATIKILSLERIRAERVASATQELMASPRVWKIDIDDKGRVILASMQTDIRERKAKILKPNLGGFSGSFNHPNRIFTEHGAIQKVRAEAKSARVTVPPEFKAELNNIKSKSIVKAGLPGAWGSAAEKNEQPSDITMSKSFNHVATKKTTVESSSPHPKPNPNL